MRASDEVIDKFPDIFKATKGYQALPINQKGSNGKVKFTYTAITGDLKLQNYYNHFKTAGGLTPSPIIDSEYCYWGAIDVDTYDLDVKNKVDLIIKAREFDLIACESKSGGLHFYSFANAPVLARRMRGWLRYCRKQLKLSSKTEIFPKQDSVEPGDYGNGITLPYRSYNLNQET